MFNILDFFEEAPVKVSDAMTVIGKKIENNIVSMGAILKFLMDSKKTASLCI